LRIVGLALLVTSDFHIPLCHQTYPGNQPDAPTFAGLTAELIARHEILANGVEDVTLIFDKGNNSLANVQTLDRSPYHFIGSLVPTQHPDLLAIATSQFRSLAEEGLPGVSAYRTSKVVFGKNRTIVVSYNQALFVAQSRTLLREIAKRQRLLGELQASLQRWHKGEVKGGRAPTVEGTKKKVAGWLAARDMRELFSVEVSPSAVGDNSVRAGACRHGVGCRCLPNEGPSGLFAWPSPRRQPALCSVLAKRRSFGPFRLAQCASRLEWEGLRPEWIVPPGEGPASPGAPRSNFALSPASLEPPRSPSAA
jgi:hypothetical protein